MRALLIYYVTQQLMVGPEKASLLYETYTATAYFTPIFGGMIADRWLGKRRAVIVGGAIMAVDHFLMASEPLLYVALATIALGNGLFLPSLPSQINDLHREEDARRRRAYNLYYVGINVGGFLAPLVCATLGEFYGWHWGFGAAGIAMLLGVTIYIRGGKYLPAAKRDAARALDRPAKSSHSFRSTFVLLIAIDVAVSVFRGAYEQVGNTVALWADVGIDCRAGAMNIPMTWFQSMNPPLVFLMTPFLPAAWKRRAARGNEPTPTRKMAFGAFIVAVSYVRRRPAGSLSAPMT